MLPPIFFQGKWAFRCEEFLLSLTLAFIVLVFSAATMYVLEGEDEPQAFGSIPRALWWSVCTLITVGYAMPTGILAAAFSDAFQRRRTRPRARWILTGRSRRNSGSRLPLKEFLGDEDRAHPTLISPFPSPHPRPVRKSSLSQHPARQSVVKILSQN